MKALLLVVIFVVVNTQLYSQINDKLKQLTEEVSIENYIWDTLTPHRSKTLDYSITIEADSLFVNLNSLDIFQNSTSNPDTLKSDMLYKAHVKDVGKIEFINEWRKPKYGDPFYDTFIEIESLRDKEIFDVLYDDGTKVKTWHIRIRVFNHSDSLKFKDISNLLNDHINPSSNTSVANCNVDQDHEWSGEAVNAVDNKNLEVPIYMNGNVCQEKDVQQLVLSYLKEQNLKGILGYFIVNESNEIQTFWTEQNNFYHLKASGAKLPAGMSTLMDNIGVMNDKQLNDILLILKAQKWGTGKCKDKNVTSYFDLAIKNESYKERNAGE